MAHPGIANGPHVALELLGTRVDVAVGGSGAGRLADVIATAWDRCLADLGAPPAATVVEAFLDDDEAAVQGAREQGCWPPPTM